MRVGRVPLLIKVESIWFWKDFYGWLPARCQSSHMKDEGNYIAGQLNEQT